MKRPVRLAAVVAVGFVLTGATAAEAQTLRGTVLDASNEEPLTLAGVYLLDRERNHIAFAMGDSLGRYSVEAPEAGEYILVAQRFGYRDLESPLLAMASERTYALDLELQPEPVGLEGITVTVGNEQVVDWLTLEFGMNPYSIPFFHMYQGERLAEAKIRGQNDPTSTLRWLYIPISHGGECVKINALPRATRTASWLSGYQAGLFGQPGDPPAGTSSRADRSPPEGPGCGSLYVDDVLVPNEHLDALDMSHVAAVVTFPGTVRLYTYGFDWGFR